jgi:hypothetical protein
MSTPGNKDRDKDGYINQCVSTVAKRKIPMINDLKKKISPVFFFSQS